VEARPWVLAETNWKTVRETAYEVAVLPWGATEAHNFHLPYATDTFQCDYVAHESCRVAWEAGAKCVALPTVPFGVQTGQLDIPFCLSMNPSTQLLVLRDIVASLEKQNVRKLVILNGHGGNDFKQMIRELSPQFDVFLCLVNWYAAVPQSEFFEDLGDHAGELETSAMLHIAPELVRPLEEAGDGREHRFNISALRERWAWTPRQWTQASDDTGIGNPQAASVEKGRAHLEAVTSKIAGFLVDLAAANTKKLYERSCTKEAEP
jgi:creatinine amidohydrolase